ncbi:MAG: hypothetical protein WA705_06990 [Candidatus Ozemobacteraceae bacterium]
MMRGKRKLRIVSFITVLFFLFSTVATYAQDAMPTTSAVPGQFDAGSVVPALISGNPQVQALTGNLTNMENALRDISRISVPLYNKLAPTNMEAMGIAERIKAIVGNAKTMVQGGMQTYKGEVGKWNAANGITPDTTFEGELGVGLNQLGVEAGKMPLSGNGNALVAKLKQIVDAIKTKLTEIIRIVRAKIAAIAQKVGLMKKDEAGKEKSSGKEKENLLVSEEQPQYADSFAGKMSKGVTEGVKNAKQSLKSSFSFTNLAVTTTVAVGTNLAIQMINGEKPSLGKAAKAVASLEFAGSVAGSALGAAGGQFASTLVKTFLPGPVGALVGAVIPVMFASAGGQIGSSLTGDLRNGKFSISKAIKSIDPVDLVGSSIGSTIGMMLGAPIPIIGPIIGGIVGGMLGSKVAKWVCGFFKGTVSVSGATTSSFKVPSGGITFGNGQSSGTSTSGQASNLTPTGDVGASPVAVSGDLTTVERKYYETYLNYNRLVESGKTDEAQKLFTDLKTYSDQYNALKASQGKTTK